jgi:UDP-3-O-[3-hydroxymyristoyl] glucosamine N-acyltransferase
MEFTLGQIAVLIGGTVEGDANKKISTISNIEEAKPGSISFLSNPKYEPFIYTTQASGVIVNEDFEPSKPVPTTMIRVSNAYLAFTGLLEEYQRMVSFGKSGIEQPHFQGANFKHGNNLYLGALAYIGQDVKVGNNVKIYPQVYIGDRVTIGDNTILYPGVKISAGCKIGSYCTLQAGAVIGSDGFGFAPQEDGSYKSIPQVGNVVLEDHVDIGANTTIDCATFESTIIRKGVKIDNLVQIAHNVEVGQNTVIAAQTGISGSTKIGKQVVIAGQVGVVGHIKIGDRVILAAKSGVSKNVPDGETWFGSPAFDKSGYMKSAAIYRRLPDMLKRIEALEAEVLKG